MDPHLSQNLSKLNRIISGYQTPKSVKMLLARSVSLSTQSSSRFLQQLNLKKQTSATASKQVKTQSQKSYAKLVRQCPSYQQLHAIRRKYSSNDGFCGLKSVLNFGSK